MSIRETIEKMIGSHPREAGFDRRELIECIDACAACAEVCTVCADACLGEAELNSLVRCIRFNLDCSDTCNATGRILSRQTEIESGSLRAQLEACSEACRICAEECERHA